MATKRDIDAVAGADGDETMPHPSSNKRARNSGNQKKSKHSQEPQTDLTYGQRSCFPSLDHSVGINDEDLEFEDETDALAYLQSVRQQASGIPHLLVAPRSGPQLPPPRATDGLAYDDDEEEEKEEPIDRSIYDDGHNDARGYYEDGAYTAAPDPFDSHNHHHHNDAEADAAANEAAKKIAEAYYNSISTHFTTLRHHLHRTPPSTASLTGDHTPHVGRFGAGSRTFTVWSARVRHTDPFPAQVASMDKGAVFRLLRVVLGGKFLRRGAELRERTSRWLWALLARLPGRGELDHMEVGYVRELGKRAALLMHSLREMAELRREVEEDDGLEGDEEDWAGEGEVVDDEEDGSAPAKRDDETTPADDHQVKEETPAQVSSDPARPSPTAPTSIPETKDEAGEQMEDGEVDESAPMDIDDGGDGGDFESAKARLLANLDALDTHESSGSSSKKTAAAAAAASASADREEEPAFDPVRARMNMRATLNMILTVAGEFYGQRDLLEFRDPFHGL
ncbi:hypothetical protein VMCG_08821 [Cytospora schulzeri]|uniref:Uncharacterized protein n=1 Tax=Cytospora schulzeri TaxID=448051 RepID=A0A423VS14_9PEZI|nr:hypothetical protein VMCG_08821 [Valsa malicola]